MEICNKEENLYRRFQCAYEIGKFVAFVKESATSFSTEFSMSVCTVASDFMLFVTYMSDETAKFEYKNRLLYRVEKLKDIAVKDESLDEIEAIERLSSAVCWLSFVDTIIDE